MKKCFKIGIFSFIIAYFILSSICTLNTYFDCKKQLSAFSLNVSTGPTQQTVELGNNLTVFDLVNISNLSGRLDIVYQNIFIFLMSLMVGVLIGIISLLKEFSKVKFLLYFLLGYIIYISLIMIFVYFCGNLNSISIFSILYDIIKKFSLIYVLFFFVIVLINIIISKYQVKIINKKIKNVKKN